jgi:hypothetical protein
VRPCPTERVRGPSTARTLLRAPVSVRPAVTDAPQLRPPVYHANDSAGGGCEMNRFTRAQKFTWNADSTPNVGTPRAAGHDAVEGLAYRRGSR